MSGNYDIKKQFEPVLAVCRVLFEKKLKDYGASWRVMRQKSITDQIFIKIKRIRSLEIKKCCKINENVEDDLIAIVNYGIIGLIQLEMRFSDIIDINHEEALSLYDKHIVEIQKLMIAKNHDYDNAWIVMRISSYTDFIFTKILRIKQIENNKEKTLVSEGINTNYMDIINYAVFGLIKLMCKNKK
ncbi:MAG: DUF1599 domain-containing protein [Bacteroidales bacterium OttesenSCG-928-I14]|nr:DUF1599 domain-containing protein [Bacteroidales bacterium OttesenSCG-928-I14]